MKRTDISFAFFTLFLSFLIALCVGGTVRGRERETENPYRLIESELLTEVREYLNRSGYTNSGVTLTRVTDGEGCREYTFTIHHGRIDRMDESEREILRDELDLLCQEAGSMFSEDACSFRHEFLLLSAVH